MTFLPIAERELRVAARRKGTYWSRLLAAFLALLIFAGVVTIAELSKQGWGNQIGTILFAIFSWLSFAFVCAAGVFLTSDCLSEEKREGTLGLLFLTDLRGYDVVLGKLLSNSLAAVYGLLAAFPVIGLAFLLGGVTGGEFWRLMLVLFNTLFFSLATGVLVSSISRDSHKAMNATVLVCLFFILLLPAIDWAMAGWNSTKFEARFCLASPGFTFTQTDNTRLGDFWTSLIIEHLLGWLFLAVASALTPRTWQETSTAPATGSTSRAQRRRFGSPEKRRAFRLRWLAGNPIRWLAARDWWLGRFQWIVLIGAGGLVALLGASVNKRRELMEISQAVQGLLDVLFFLWVASYASRFFVEATRTGTLELLLATPVGAEQIVRGQAWALRRTFLWPGLVLLFIATVLNALEIEQTLRIFSSTPPTGPPTPLPPGLIANQVISAVGGKVMFVTGLLAVAWLGMWMGVTSKKINAAVIKTVVFVKVLPFLAMMFVNWTLMFVVFASGSGFLFRTMKVPTWVPELITFLLAIGGDVVFILVARRKLLKNFRNVVARAAGVATALKPAPLPLVRQPAVLPLPAP